MLSSRVNLGAAEDWTEVRSEGRPETNAPQWAPRAPLPFPRGARRSSARSTSRRDSVQAGRRAGGVLSAVRLRPRGRHLRRPQRKRRCHAARARPMGPGPSAPPAAWGGDADDVSDADGQLANKMGGRSLSVARACGARSSQVGGGTRGRAPSAGRPPEHPAASSTWATQEAKAPAQVGLGPSGRSPLRERPARRPLTKPCASSDDGVEAPDAESLETVGGRGRPRSKAPPAEPFACPGTPGLTLNQRSSQRQGQAMCPASTRRSGVGPLRK